MKKNLAIVIGGTSNIAYAVYVTFTSVIRHSSLKDYEFIIFNDEWDDSIKKIFTCQYHKTKFVNYTFNEFKKHFDNEDIINKQSWAMKTFSFMVYCKFEIFNLLYEYKSVIWLDSDTFIRGCLTQIFSYGPIAATKIPSDLNSMFKNETKYTNIPAYNGGVIYLTDDINFKSLTELCYKYMVNTYDNLKLPDQAVFGWLFYTQNLHINNLPIKFNDSLAALDDSVVVHFNRKYSKPWNNALIRVVFSDYLLYLKDFCSKASISETTINKNFFKDILSDSIKSILSKIEFQYYWKYIYMVTSPFLNKEYFFDVFWGERMFILKKDTPNIKSIYINRSPLSISFIHNGNHLNILKRSLSSFKYRLNFDNQLKKYIFTFDINLFNYCSDINILLNLFEPYIYCRNLHNQTIYNNRYIYITI